MPKCFPSSVCEYSWAHYLDDLWWDEDEEVEEEDEESFLFKSSPMEIDDQPSKLIDNQHNHHHLSHQQPMIAATPLFNINPGGPTTPGGMPDGSPPSLMEQQSRNSMQRQSSRRESLEDADGAARMKICRVCGDSATGYNFNVISCESCKAFFRRNALRPKDFKCPYANDCEINAVSRRFCQKCRLRKCFVVGMKKEWILSDDQLKRRKNARIKGQMGRGGDHQPRTPSSNGSMAPATPFDGLPSANGGNNAFSPPQQFYQQFQQQQQQQPQPPRLR